MTKENELERNVGYVIKVLEGVNFKYGFGEADLVVWVRLEHSRDNPLGLKDARDAISEAEKRRLIRKYNFDIIGERYVLNK